MKKRRILGLVGVSTLLVTLFVVGGRTTRAATLTVTSIADNGPGTLRQAMLDAVNGDTITFDTAVFPPSSPVTIALTSGPLPTITQGNLTIDASNAGVIIDGSSVSDGDGLRITSDSNTIKGLQIIRFPNDGVEITNGAKYNAVSGNYIGTDASGTTALGNHGNGIVISVGASYNLIGGDEPGERNVISGNVWNDVGIWDVGTNHNTVSGNFVGTDASGAVAVANPHRGTGIVIGNGASFNTIGGDAPSERNVIGGNINGIGIWQPGTNGNVVAGNYIGVDSTGANSLSNDVGIEVSLGAQRNRIGPDNVIGSNRWYGVHILNNDTVSNTVTQNSIHSNDHQGIELRAGGNLELSAPVITSIDRGAGTVAGTACASCTIEVFSDDEDEGLIYEGTTIADASGNWLFAQGSSFQETYVTATATDSQGNTSEFSLVPFIEVNQDHNWVAGPTPLPNAEVEVVVFDSQGSIKGTRSALSDEQRWFLTEVRDQDDNWIDIAIGDVVSVTVDETLVITAEVVPMTGDVDIAADAITGSVPSALEGQEVQAEIWNLSYWPGDFEDTVQADGSYTLHVADFDIRDGHMVGIWYRNEQGNFIGIVRHWLQIETYGEGSAVWGRTKPNVDVEVTVANDRIKGTGTATAYHDGNYLAEIYDGTQPVTIRQGDTITVTADGRATAMTVETLTGVMDFYADAICGIAPPNSEVKMRLWDVFDNQWYDVDASGHYCAELDFDLHSGHQGEVVLFDERGHATKAPLTHRDRQVTSLSLGNALEDSVESLAYSDYVLEIDAGENLLVQVTPQSGIGQIWLYGRLDDLPSRAQRDFQATKPTASGTYELLVSPTRQDSYYLSVLGWDIIGQQGTYTVIARTVDRHLSDVRPRSVGNAGQVTLAVQGLGFANGMHVELRRSGSPTLVANDVIQLSSTAMSAHFDLTGVKPGIYDAVVIWPDSTEEALTTAFEVFAGGVGPQLEASLDAPEFVRPDRTFILWLDYANTGDADMSAPLFVISSADSVPMRLADQEPFEDGPAQVMGLNPDGYAGSLSPDTSGRIPIYFHVPSDAGPHQMLDFDLAIMISDTIPIDWDEVEDDIRPPDVDPEVWDVLWPNLTAQIGDTWGDYRQSLADNAGYLSSLGRIVYSARELFRFEVRKVLGMNPRRMLADSLDAYAPAPGMPLQFERVFPGSLEGRFYLGPLGRGWSHRFDIYLEEHSNGDILLHWPGSFTRLFPSNGDGTYTALPGDCGILTYDGDTFALTENDGSVYRFRTDGQLDYVEEPNGNRITAVYNGSGQLIEIGHSSGDAFELEYDTHGRIFRLTDHVGRVTEYGYDATGEHLLTVTTPGNRIITYTYNSPSGQPTDHALRSITYPDSTHRYYDFEGLGRLSEEQLDGGAERISYTYDAYGRIHVTDAAGEAAIISPDEHGRPAQVQDALAVCRRENDGKVIVAYKIACLGQDLM